MNEPVVLVAKLLISFLLITPDVSIVPENVRLTQSDFKERLGETLKYLKIFDDILSPVEWAII